MTDQHSIMTDQAHAVGMQAAAATTISSAALAHTARAHFLLKRQATIKIQTAARGRASRMLISSFRAAKNLVRFLGSSTERTVEEAVAKALATSMSSAMSSALSVQQTLSRSYQALGAAVAVVALTLVILDADPACPLLGVSAAILLLSVQPADNETRIRSCAVALALLLEQALGVLFRLGPLWHEQRCVHPLVPNIIAGNRWSPWVRAIPWPQ